MKTGRKISGGKYHKQRKKKLYEMPGLPRNVKLGEERKKKLRIRGGSLKTVLLVTNKVNLMDKNTHKSKVVKIKSIIDVPSNRYVKDVMVKGTIIDTESGRARITNRPGQEGNVQAIIIEEKK